MLDALLVVPAFRKQTLGILVLIVSFHLLNIYVFSLHMATSSALSLLTYNKKILLSFLCLARSVAQMVQPLNG